MKEFLIFILSTSDILFIPLILGLLFAFVLEISIKKPEFESFRRFMWRQNLFFNIVWFICWSILMVMMNSEMRTTDIFSTDGIVWR